MARMIKVGIAQIGFDEKSGKSKIEQLLPRIKNWVSNDELDILVLPELWASSSHDSSLIEKNIIEPKLLRETFEPVLLFCKTNCFIGSFPLKVGKDIRNSVLFRSRLGFWRDNLYKAIPFGFGLGESSIVKGSKDIGVADLGFAKAQVLVCFDLRFPELSRQPESIPELIVVVASWPKKRIDHWKKLVMARAIENQAWVIACNSTGLDVGIEMGGNSSIVNPNGEIIACADQEEALIIASIDLDEVSNIRTTFPALGLRPGLKE
jgi:predicted amidohydrolase